jgi:hypothetical protein
MIWQATYAEGGFCEAVDGDAERAPVEAWVDGTLPEEEPSFFPVDDMGRGGHWERSISPRSWLGWLFAQLMILWIGT